MYQQYFNFSEPPFSISPDPHFMYMSERHQEGLAHLLYGIDRGGGFVALTGEVGTGKTTLCHCLLQQLPANIDIALILNPKLSAIELLATICDELGIAHDGMTAKNLIDAINQYLLSAYAAGRRTVLLIDEAQNLSLEVLEQIRLLTNLETSKAKLLQIVLVGQPELNAMLARRELRQLNQRITARYHLLPLSFDETKAYIQHRLRVCRGSHRLFSAAAIRRIYRYSAGVPRLINILCDRALLGAYATDAGRITPAIVSRSARESLGLKSWLPRWLPAVAAAVLVAGAMAGGYVWRHELGLVSPAKPLTVPEAAVSKPVVAQPENPAFRAWLEYSAPAFDAALGELLRIWGAAAPAGRMADCRYAAELGLYCLPGSGNWKDVLALDRPALLEFADGQGGKRFVPIQAVEQGRTLVLAGGAIRFPLADVLADWDGNFLLLWRSPRPGVSEIAAPQKSAEVLWLRDRLGQAMQLAKAEAEPDYFDDTLKRQLAEFQRRQHLAADGIAGARTLIRLDNLTGAADSPHLQAGQR
ncbi:ExeA family protein [Methylomonas koyamae]|uniref:ExeA family protein n=1 Tax=Methylomonas koyamae TaxID=702114 RepID=UPI002873E14B|nr:AAA family ATPase [Methylomonas koyamae]WNB75425.1 AAA family ATPase [Methylomonas koyamae]